MQIFRYINLKFLAMAQYRLIAQLCGSPDLELLAKLASNEAILNVITKLGVYSRKSFSDYFPKKFSKHLVDFMDRILVLDPEKRQVIPITALYYCLIGQ